MMNAQSISKASNKSIKCKFCSHRFVNGDKFYTHVYVKHYRSLLQVARKRITRRKQQESHTEVTPQPIRISVIKQRHTVIRNTVIRV